MRSVKNGLQNTRQSQDTTGDQVPFETPWRSHSIAICRHGREKDKRIATHYCKTRRFDAPVPMHKLPQHTQTSIAIATHYSTTHRFDAPVPMHKVCQHMQNTKSQQHSINKEEKKSPGTLSYIARAVRARFHAKAAMPQTVTRANLLLSATEAPFTQKRQCSVQILTFKSHPWCSSSNAICKEWLAKHKTIARHYWRPSTFRDTLAQPFHCDLQKRTWKRQCNRNILL